MTNNGLKVLSQGPPVYTSGSPYSHWRKSWPEGQIDNSHGDEDVISRAEGYLQLQGPPVYTKGSPYSHWRTSWPEGIVDNADGDSDVIDAFNGPFTLKHKGKPEQEFPKWREYEPHTTTTKD